MLHLSLARNTEHESMGSEFDFTLGHFVENSSKLGIIVDFDGTLSPLARTPEHAFIPPEAKKVLERLSNLTDVHVVVISGRELQDLRTKVSFPATFFLAFRNARFKKKNLTRTHFVYQNKSYACAKTHLAHVRARLNKGCAQICI